jgi:hypothetical protein
MIELAQLAYEREKWHLYRKIVTLKMIW